MTTSDPKSATVPEEPKGTRPSTRPGGPESLIGTTLSGRYRIERLLGEGGMGAVYQAQHTHMRKRLAVKVLHPEMSRLPEVVARFEREAMAAAHIDHPNVATATDFGKLEDGSFFLVLEFVEGKSLRDALVDGRLELGRALRILRQIAAALQRAHALGIVHRDLKPENVMLIDRDGEKDFVKVLDFGIAKVPVGEIVAGGDKGDKSDKSGPAQPALTQLGMVYGTPEYMAPEQALGQSVDPRADIYGLGVMTFEMLAGVRPFDHESKVTLLGMHVTAPVPAIAAKAPAAKVPAEVEAIVTRMLSKESTHRYADAKELLDALDAVWLNAYGVAPGSTSQAGPPSMGRGSRASITSVPDLPILGARQASADGDSPLPNVRRSAADFFARASGLVKEHPRPFIYAGLGASALIAVVLLVALFAGAGKAKGDAADAGDVATAADAAVDGAVSADPDADAQVTAALGMLEKGDYGTSIERLVELEKAHPDRVDIHHGLERAYTATRSTTDAMREASLWLQADPGATKDLKLDEDIRNAALGKEAGDAAFALLETKMGSAGPDILYDMAYGPSSGSYPRAAGRAKQALAKSAVRALASPALAVTLEARALSTSGGSCEARKAVVEKAEGTGDLNTLSILKSWTATSGCGFARSRDCYPCLHRDGSLKRAIDAIEERQKH